MYEARNYERRSRALFLPDYAEDKENDPKEGPSQPRKSTASRFAKHRRINIGEDNDSTVVEGDFHFDVYASSVVNSSGDEIANTSNKSNDSDVSTVFDLNTDFDDQIDNVVVQSQSVHPPTTTAPTVEFELNTDSNDPTGNVVAQGESVLSTSTAPAELNLSVIDPSLDMPKHALFGCLSYETKENERLIMFNGVELRAHTVSLLGGLNMHDNNVYVDKKFVFMLMLELFSVDDMVAFNLEPLKKSIIKGNDSHNLNRWFWKFFENCRTVKQTFESVRRPTLLLVILHAVVLISLSFFQTCLKYELEVN